VSSPAEEDGVPVVAAGGGAVWRHASDGGLEVAVVHRPRYDDWSLPKGKLTAGEHTLTGAVREVGEETGLAVVAGRRSVRVEYPVPEGLKRVDYWVMQAVGGDFEANSEVDEMRWVPLHEAPAFCSHDADRVVLADLARTDVPLMPTLLLVRHARAGDRSEWDGPDDLRPLDPRGREQAQQLADVLPLFRPDDLLSAPPVRCMETVEPLAGRVGLDIRPVPELSEDGFAADPDAGLALVEQLLAPREGPGVTVVCSQGGAIPYVLMALGVPFEERRAYPPCAKGSTWVLGGRPGALSADYYRDFDPDPDAPAPR
jgi:8-oxo-dGTP diphosphatase